MKPRTAALLLALGLGCATTSAATSTAAAASPEPARYLNLDFEDPGYPHDWYTGSEGYAVDLDSLVRYTGRQSLRIRFVGGGRVGIATQSLPAAAAAGHVLRISAFVRTEGIMTGWARIWCRVDGADRMPSNGSARSAGARGTTPWTRQSLEVPIDSAATHIDFGALLTGDGTAWFDHFEISIDGVPYAQPPAPLLPDPAGAQLDWLRRHAVPLRGDAPELPCDDLVPVLRMVGNARLVGLGEGTHGTHEFTRVKQRLIRCLVEELGFTIVAAEVNGPEAARLDHYLLTGEGNPRALLPGLRAWPWNTEEGLSVIEWLRAYNASGRGPVRFLGFDMQYPAPAMDSLLAFATRADPLRAQALAESLRVVALTHATRGRGSAGGAVARVDASLFAGHRVHLRGFVRTEEVAEGFAGLLLRAEGDSGTVAEETMADRGVSGTTGWQACAESLQVPARARKLTFGVVLAGSGAAWFDSLALDVDPGPSSPGGRIVIDFEDPVHGPGLRPFGFAYRVGLDSTVARSGRWSLLVGENVPVAAALKDARWARAEEAARSVVRALESDSAALAGRAPPAEVTRALDNALLVLQSCEGMRSFPARDRCMAENAERFLDRAPARAKMILWAHDAHVSRRPGAMGAHLAARYGSGYVPVALLFHEGHYTAGDGRRLEAYEAAPSRPGSLEWALHRTGLPALALDLREASPADSASAWLRGELESRSIGLLPVQQAFFRSRIADEFDAVLFFDRTGPLRPLR